MGRRRSASPPGKAGAPHQALPRVPRSSVPHQRGPGAAIRVLDQGLALCRATDNRDWSRSIAAGLGHTYALTGHIAEGRSLLEEALKDDLRTGSLHAHSHYIAQLSEICLLEGRHDEAWQHARQALDLARQFRERGYEADALYQLGAVYAHANPPDAEPGRNALPAGARPGRGTWHASAPGPLPPRPWHAVCQDRPAGTGYAELSAAIALYRAMEMTFWLPQAEAALAQVSGC